VTDTANHNIVTVASGSAAAILAIPPSADLDGRGFVIQLGGRVKLTSGATPGNFNITIQQNNPTPQVVKTYTLALPANASNVVLPFTLGIQGFYDTLAQTLRVFSSGILGNSSNNTVVNPTGSLLANTVTLANLSFSAYYNFSVAPLSATVEISEFVL
jgi:hypothetical protein